MYLIARSAIASFALILAAPAVAQERAPAPSPPEIIVTGTHDREGQVRAFVKALTPAPGGSIPRFISAVCPMVTGLVAAQNDAVAARLREVAAGAHIDVAGPGCVPNAFVIVTRDKRAFIDLLAKRQPYSFATMSGREVRALARSPGPAAAWQLEGPVNSSGIPLNWDPSMGVYVNRTTEASSRLKMVDRRGFDAAALVVEIGALDGLTATQLADYAAMRLLAKLDPARLPAGTPPTILTVLTTPMGAPVPITMTKWDLGFLRGLYASALDLPPNTQRSRIAERMIRPDGE